MVEKVEAQILGLLADALPFNSKKTVKGVTTNTKNAYRSTWRQLATTTKINLIFLLIFVVLLFCAHSVCIASQSNLTQIIGIRCPEKIEDYQLPKELQPLVKYCIKSKNISSNQIKELITEVLIKNENFSLPRERFPLLINNAEKGYRFAQSIINFVPSLIKDNNDLIEFFLQRIPSIKPYDTNATSHYKDQTNLIKTFILNNKDLRKNFLEKYTEKIITLLGQNEVIVDFCDMLKKIKEFVSVNYIEQQMKIIAQQVITRKNFISQECNQQKLTKEIQENIIKFEPKLLTIFSFLKLGYLLSQEEKRDSEEKEKTMNIFIQILEAINIKIIEPYNCNISEHKNTIETNIKNLTTQIDTLTTQIDTLTTQRHLIKKEALAQQKLKFFQNK